MGRFISYRAAIISAVLACATGCAGSAFDQYTNPAEAVDGGIACPVGLIEVTNTFRHPKTGVKYFHAKCRETVYTCQAAPLGAYKCFEDPDARMDSKETRTALSDLK